MKRDFIIECDSDLSTVFLYEARVVLNKDGEWIAERGEKIINAWPDPKFYGVLDALLITAERLSNAPPVVPEPPKEVAA